MTRQRECGPILMETALSGIRLPSSDRENALGMTIRSQIIITVIVTFFLIAFFLSIYVTVEEKMPGNAVVVITPEDGLYHSIHFDQTCVADKQALATSLDEAIKKGLRPDPRCDALNYFKGNTRFLFHDLLARMGVSVNSRWDREGNWRW
jgi:hypothetical protein